MKGFGGSVSREGWVQLEKNVSVSLTPGSILRATHEAREEFCTEGVHCSNNLMMQEDGMLQNGLFIAHSVKVFLGYSQLYPSSTKFEPAAINPKQHPFARKAHRVTPAHMDSAGTHARAVWQPSVSSFDLRPS